MGSDSFNTEYFQEQKNRQERVLQHLANRLRQKSFTIDQTLWENPELTFLNQGNALRHFLKQHQCYKHLETFPSNPFFSALYSQKSFLKKKTTGWIHGVCLIQWKPLLEGKLTPLTREELDKTLALLVSTEKVLNLIALYHLGGFEKELYSHQEGLLHEVPYQLYFIEDHPHSGFSVQGKSTGLRQIFEPQEPEEKEEKLRNYLKLHKKLSIRGGYLTLQEIAKDWGSPEKDLKPLMEALLKNHEELFLEEIRQTLLIKRRIT